MQKKYNHYLLLLILLFSFFIRIWKIDAAPASLNWDEVSHGFNAYSILTTGKDEWSESFPAIFRAYGDYKLPVYVNLVAISESLFGLNPFSVRLPSILAGCITVLFSYLLVKKLFKKEEIALLTALLVAIEPWNLFLSRAALEANVALALIVSGVYFLLSGLEKKNCSLLLGIALFGLSVWTYNSARIFIPLLLIALTLIHKTEFYKIVKSSKSLATFYMLLAIVFLVPMFIQVSSGVGLARYESVQILNDTAIGRIGELRSNLSFDESVERLLFNKATYFAGQFTVNYLKHFSPEFLYLKGGDNYQFNIPNIGLLYLVNAPFLVLGIWRLFKQHGGKKYGKLIIAWLLIAPVASSLTEGAPHTLRSIVMLPIPMILTALGASYVFSRLAKFRWLFVVFALLLFVSFADYFNIYLSSYRVNYSWVWQYGYRQAVDFIKTNYNKYEKIVITKKYGEPHEFVLFYWPWDPSRFQNQDKTRYYQSNWYWVDKFDKFYFVNDWDIPKVGSEFALESGGTFDCASCLLVTSPGNAPENWKKIETINFLDGKIAFEIYEH
ncbi:hypothetical protein A2897_00685 [Candidatus Woesebacteria bacterium RIFCSPLOWO2_01_FULL_44_24b]|nr:MAG: hypothetical protein A2897_00685 [Candidatus Woesebacteria bacterium RIFCSPLOWO2_01_FULL_44_24b]